MNLLILTQKVDVNDAILGFFHNWIEEFAENFKQVSVVCLEKGEFKLPRNVEVFSLGKERSKGKFGYVINFFKFIFKLRNQYDTVFVHMNPEYLVLGGWIWKIFGKKTALWYVHRAVNLKLRIAEIFADRIFSVSKDTFNLKSSKLETVGHGIPIEFFKRPDDWIKEEDKFIIISVGRISPIKNLEILIDAAKILKSHIKNLKVEIVGGPALKGDTEYLRLLEERMEQNNLKDFVFLKGEVGNEKIRKYYWNSDVSVNLAPTGGVDKAVLESMASGLPVFVSNLSFSEYFGKYKNLLIFKERNAEDLSQKILDFIDNSEKKNITDFLLRSVTEKSNLHNLILKISKKIK